MTSFALLWQKTGFFSKRLAFAFSTVFASKAASSGLLGAGSAAGIVAGGMVTAAGCGAGVCSAWGAAGDVGGCSTWGVAASGAGTACWGAWNGLVSGAAVPLDVPVPKISLMSRPSYQADYKADQRTFSSPIRQKEPALRLQGGFLLHCDVYRHVIHEGVEA